MCKNKLYSLILVVITGTTSFYTMAREKSDNNNVEKYTWKTEDIYQSIEEWKNTKAEVETMIPKMAEYKGKLGISAKDLLNCLSFYDEINLKLDHLYLYAHMNNDKDTRDAKYNAMKQEIAMLNSRLASVSAYMEPELLRIAPEKIHTFISEEVGLKDYDFYLENLMRLKDHQLSEEGERIMAEASPLSRAPSQIFGTFSNAEFPYPEINLSDGEKVRLTPTGFAKNRTNRVRKDREVVFDTFFGELGRFKQTFGEQLFAQVKKNIFVARSRNYESSLHSSLSRNNIPETVYTALIDNVNKNLDAYHRYLQLKKRMLGIDTMKYSDIYASAVKGIKLHYPVDQAKSIILESLEPLGNEYKDIVKRAFDEGWIDYYPGEGKRTGAYSTSAYGIHPYILLNYNEQYSDLRTLAHELGHTMHSYFANSTQPYPKADYATFVAEVASTFNEQLLFDHLIKTIKDPDIRLALLMEYLDGIRGTLFRQTQFAEFELAIHKEAEKGNALTGDVLTEIYGDIVKKYHGHDKNICKVKDTYSYEWAYIPHFYYNFYVYQYATSFTASTALAEKVLNHKKGALEAYLEFLKSGGSEYPIEILAKAGVDMSSSEPFNHLMKRMNDIMDEVEGILENKK